MGSPINVAPWIDCNANSTSFQGISQLGQGIVQSETLTLSELLICGVVFLELLDFLRGEPD
jgi:hypothetical protein